MTPQPSSADLLLRASNQPPQQGLIGLELRVVRVPRRRHVAYASGQVGTTAGSEARDPLTSRLRSGRVTLGEQSDQPGLLTDERIRAAIGLEVAEHVQVRDAREHQCREQLRTSALVVGDRSGEKRDRRAVAGCPDDEVDVLHASIGEVDARAVEPNDVRPRPDVPVGEEVQDLRIHDRVRLEHAVVWRRQPEATEVTDEDLEQSRQQRLRDASWQVWSTAKERVRRLAKYVLRQEVIAAPHRDERAGGARRGVAGDVASRVSATDDQDPPALELRRSAVP